MANKIKPRRSYTANSVPLVSDLDENEMAVNWTDGKLFVRQGNTIVAHTLGGSGGGGGGGSASVVSAATAAGFPATGSAANLYVATDSRKLYGWDSTNSVYVELGPLAGGSQSLQVTIPASDPFYSNVLLLLHGNGNLTDSSGYGRSVTANGNAAATAPGKFGSASIALDGTGDYLSLTSNDFAWGTADYTVEAWVWLTSYGSYGAWFSTLFSNANFFKGVAAGVDNNGYPLLLHLENYNIVGTSLFPLQQWVHVQVARANGVITYYVNGTSVGSVTVAWNYSNPDVVVGRFYTELDAAYWNGRIDELRVTRGVARAVSVPTAAYPDLTPQVIPCLPAT